MNRRELEMLMQDLFDGRLGGEAMASLQRELRTDPEARDTYRDYVHLHNALQLRAEGIDLLHVVPMDRVVARRQRRHLRHSILAAAAVVALIATVMAFVHGWTPPPTLTFRTSDGSDYTTTHLTVGKDAPEGQGLVPGSRLVVRRGTVELEFRSGIRGIIRAPADVTLQREDHLFLEQGTGWFNVAPKAVGFKVSTSDLTVADLGTEFGIRAKPDFLSEVHVFTGKVEVGSRYGLKAKEIVTAGQSRKAGPAGGLQEIPLSTKPFLTHLPATESGMRIRTASFPHAPKLDHSFGSLELALNLGNGGALVRDGIPFANADAGSKDKSIPGPDRVVFGAANGIEVTGGVAHGDFRTDRLLDPQAPGYDPLFHSQAFQSRSQSWGIIDGPEGMPLNVTGLDPTRIYRIQILFAEPRKQFAYDHSVTVTDDSGESESAQLLYGPGGSPQAFALATIDLSGSRSLLFAMPDTQRAGPSIAGVVIHSAPAQGGMTLRDRPFLQEKEYEIR
jgi:ferric-dicitrate binding protein FerR (iron transport regulator)